MPAKDMSLLCWHVLSDTGSKINRPFILIFLWNVSANIFTAPSSTGNITAPSSTGNTAWLTTSPNSSFPKARTWKSSKHRLRDESRTNKEDGDVVEEFEKKKSQTSHSPCMFGTIGKLVVRTTTLWSCSGLCSRRAPKIADASCYVLSAVRCGYIRHLGMKELKGKFTQKYKFYIWQRVEHRVEWWRSEGHAIRHFGYIYR